MVVHPSAEAVLQAAGLGAHAAVAAALADEGGHITLARVTEAQGPVYKDLRLDGGIFGNEADLLQAQLPCQHRAGHSQLRGGFRALEVVDRHLCARVQRDVGQVLADRGGQAQILHQDRVGPGLACQACALEGALHLPVVDQGVERHIHLAAADAAVTDRALELLAGEVFGAAAGVEIAHSHIDSVRAVLHRGDDSLGRSGGRQQFHHICAPLFMSAKMIVSAQRYRVSISQTQVLRQEDFRVILSLPVNKA